MKDSTTPGTGLWARIARARKNMAAIPKNGRNPHFGNAYATLADIEAIVLPALEEEGLLVTAGGVRSGEGWALGVTIRATDSRDEEGATCLVPLLGLADMQKVGGAFSYARRYGLVSLLSLEVGDHDDDGNLASGVGAQGRAPAPPQRPATAPHGRGAAPQPGARKPDACPTCGNAGSIRRLSKGKDAGLWVCMKWPEKGFNGCASKFTSDPSKWGEKEKAAHGIPPQADEPPIPSNDDLPF